MCKSAGAGAVDAGAFALDPEPYRPNHVRASDANVGALVHDNSWLTGWVGHALSAPRTAVGVALCAAVRVSPHVPQNINIIAMIIYKQYHKNMITCIYNI